MKIITYKKVCILLFILLVLSACSAKNTPLVSPQASPDVPRNLQEEASCAGAMIAIGSYSPNPATLASGQALINVTIKATGRCFLFRLIQSDKVPELKFSSSQTFQVVYTSAGTFNLDVGVEAIDLKDRVLETKTISLTIQIAQPSPSPSPSASPSPSPSPSISPSPSPSPSVSPTPSPSPSPSPIPVTCAIGVIGPVSNTNGTLPLFISGSGPIVSAKLNGQSFTINSAVQIPPTVLNTGQYRADVTLIGTNQQTGGCLYTHQAPIVNLDVLSVSSNKVDFKLTLFGTISAALLDAIPMSLPIPPINEIFYSKTPPGPGNYSALAEVFNNVTGDHGSQQKSYCVPHPAITSTGDNWSADYHSDNGYVIPSSVNKIKAGRTWVSLSGGVWTMRILERSFNTQMKTMDPIVRQGWSLLRCPPDYAWVGDYAPVNEHPDLACAKLVTAENARVTLINETEKYTTAQAGNSVVCDPGQVGVGKKYELIGTIWKYTIYCRTPVWTGECGQ